MRGQSSHFRIISIIAKKINYYMIYNLYLIIGEFFDHFITLFLIYQFFQNRLSLINLTLDLTPIFYMPTSAAEI